MYQNKRLPLYVGGFTMIEILIVVIMIALLAVVGGTAYTATMETSRDGRRKIDMQNIRNALELYRSDFSTYPVLDNTLTGETFTLRELLDPPTGKKYITLPVDPRTDAEYAYVPECEEIGTTAVVCNSYMLGVTLENAPASVADDCANLEAGPGMPACTDTDGQPAKCTFCLDPYGEITDAPTPTPTPNFGGGGGGGDGI